MSVSLNLLDDNVSGAETDISGWTAGTNTALARYTTGWYSGAATMALKAVAAGSITATIKYRVAVMGNTDYMAYAYFGNLQAVTGRTITVRIDFYAGASGGAALLSATSAVTALPTSGWLTPPPIVIATSPSNAAYASVTVSGASFTAGAGMSVDAIALGPPAVLPDNMLNYAVQSSETGVTGWQSVTNTTVDRKSTTSYEGWYALTLTSVTAGPMDVRASAGNIAPGTVTPGVEYTAFAYVQPPASGIEFRIQLLWYAADGSLVGARETYSHFPDAGSWTRCAVIGTAPAGSHHARLVLAPQATASGQTWTVDQAAVMVAPSLPGNLLGYRDQSFETDVSGWTAVQGCTVTRSAGRPWDGQGSMRIYADGSGDATVMLANPVPVTPRQAYKLAPHVYRAGAGDATRYDAVFVWLDADGETIDSGSYRWVTGTSVGWYTITGNAVAPVGAVSLRAGLKIESPPAGSSAYVDAVSLTADGVGVVADLVPNSYGVRISLQGMTTGGYPYWSLYRIGPDGSLTAVRGASGDLTQADIVGNLAVAEDYEAPLGVPVTYYLKLFSTSTLYRAYSSDPITLPEPPENAVVIKDPGLPARQTTAVVEKGGLPDWQRAARQGTNVVRGRSRPIVISDVRTSRTGTMSLVTETADELSNMWWLLETGNVLLIQWPAEWHEDDVYVSIGDVTETHVAEYARYSDRTWSIPLTEVDRPVGGTAGSASRTWQTVLDESPDWLAVLTTYSSWLDVYTGVEGA